MYSQGIRPASIQANPLHTPSATQTAQKFNLHKLAVHFEKQQLQLQNLHQEINDMQQKKGMSIIAFANKVQQYRTLLQDMKQDYDAFNTARNTNNPAAFQEIDSPLSGHQTSLELLQKMRASLEGENYIHDLGAITINGNLDATDPNHPFGEIQNGDQNMQSTSNFASVLSHDLSAHDNNIAKAQFAVRHDKVQNLAFQKFTETSAVTQVDPRSYESKFIIQEYTAAADKISDPQALKSFSTHLGDTRYWQLRSDEARQHFDQLLIGLPAADIARLTPQLLSDSILKQPIDTEQQQIMTATKAFSIYQANSSLDAQSAGSILTKLQSDPKFANGITQLLGNPNLDDTKRTSALKNLYTIVSDSNNVYATGSSEHHAAIIDNAVKLFSSNDYIQYASNETWVNRATDALVKDNNFYIEQYGYEDNGYQSAINAANELGLPTDIDRQINAQLLTGYASHSSIKPELALNMQNTMQKDGVFSNAVVQLLNSPSLDNTTRDLALKNLHIIASDPVYIADSITHNQVMADNAVKLLTSNDYIQNASDEQWVDRAINALVKTEQYGYDENGYQSAIHAADKYVASLSPRWMDPGQ